MRWTVKNKMFAMGLLVCAGLLLLTGVSYQTNTFSGQSADILELRTEQVSVLNDFKVAAIISNLAAMDAIVDSADGTVSQGVRQEMAGAVDFMSQTIPLLAELAVTPEEKDAARQIEKGLSQLRPVLDTELFAAIASFADAEEFARLDDVIDGQLSLVIEDIDKLLNSVKSEAGEANHALHGRLDSANLILFSIVAAILILLGPSSYFFYRGIIVPLRDTKNMLSELELGHLGQRLNVTSQDEIGDMARSMDSFADSLQSEIVDNLERLASGDLTFTVEPRDNRDVLRGALKKVVDDLHQLLGEVQQSCNQIAAGSNQVSDSSQSLSQGATESASSLEEIAASMNEMAAQTNLNAENSKQANNLTVDSKQAAERGNQQMAQMVTAMGEINESSQSISKIIKVIDEIAFQTNLLALNAAVEAARAGQHGKGFAVVAEEVRNLAARSAKAASETSDLIEGSVVKTKNGAEIADVTALGLHEIVNSITTVADLVGEITVASNEQAQGISQVNQGLGQIDQVTQQNTANAEEGAAASEELSSQADQLRQIVSRFRLKEQSQSFQQAVAPQVHRQSRPASQGVTSGWGGNASNPVAQISLDDDDFGKF